MNKSLALLALLVVAGFGSGPAASQTILTASSWVPPTQPLAISQKEWCESLEKKSAGNLKCNFLPRGVSAPPGTYDAIRNGLADISFTVHGYTPGRFIYSQMAELPFLGNNAEAISVAYTKTAARYPAFAAEHEGTKVIALFTHGPGAALNTKRPVTKIADLHGLKWRVGGGMANEIAKSLGMNATLKPGPEAYELLSNGILDGSLFAIESIDTFKLNKIVKHATIVPGGLFNLSFVFLMNKDRYEKLSDSERKIVDSVSGESAARIFGREWDRVDLRGMALAQASSIQVVKADSPFLKEIKEKTAPLEKKWMVEAAGKGLQDPGKVLSEFRAEIAKQEK